MPERSNASFEAKCLAVASMLVEMKMKPHEIARQLNVVPSTVTRWSNAGRGKYWVESGCQKGPGFDLAPEDLKVEARAFAQRRHLGPRDIATLAGASDEHLLSVQVLSCNWEEWRARQLEAPADRAKREAVWQSWLATFGRLAMPRALELLAKGKIWGVTWGSQVDAVIAAIAAEYSQGRHPRNDMRVIPLCGTRCGARLASESSSALAENLERAMTGRVDDPVSFGQVPAIIQGDLDQDELRGLYKYIASSPAWVSVFGSARLPAEVPVDVPVPDPLAGKADGVLTSVSRDGHPFGYGSQRMFAGAGYEREEIESCYFGDMGGIGLLREGQEPHPVLESRWTGITRDDMRAVAARAAQEKNGGAVGVVLIASGEDRVKSVLESVRNGLVSHLIIDEGLNKAIEGSMKQSGWPGPVAPSQKPGA